jgi:hypothetical protein
MQMLQNITRMLHTVPEMRMSPLYIKHLFTLIIYNYYIYMYVYITIQCNTIQYFIPIRVPQGAITNIHS